MDEYSETRCKKTGMVLRIKKTRRALPKTKRAVTVDQWGMLKSGIYNRRPLTKGEGPLS